jgi:hypothetical protein
LLPPVIYNLSTASGHIYTRNYQYTRSRIVGCRCDAGHCKGFGRVNRVTSHCNLIKQQGNQGVKYVFHKAIGIIKQVFYFFAKVGLKKLFCFSSVLKPEKTGIKTLYWLVLGILFRKTVFNCFFSPVRVLNSKANAFKVFFATD